MCVFRSCIFVSKWCRFNPRYVVSINEKWRKCHTSCICIIDKWKVIVRNYWCNSWKIWYNVNLWMNWKNNTTKSSKKIVEKKSNEWQTKASPIVMANTSSFQIDNFLEHFKRSASKSKMDSTDWTSNEATSSQGYANAMATTAAATFNHSSPLKTTRTRSSCFDISSISGSRTFGHNKGNFREWGGRTEPSLNTIQSQIEMGAHIGYFYKV